jgi:ligand-binding sensor domain-containing protein
MEILKQIKRNTVYVVALVFLFSFQSACKDNDTSKEIIEDPIVTSETVEKINTNKNLGIPFVQPTPAVPYPISQFVRRIFQDSRGNMWMGTNGDGVLFYNGKKVTQFSIDEGFDGLAVRSIVEDRAGLIWFGTENGIITYDPNVSAIPTKASFIKFTLENDLPHHDIWNLMIDRTYRLWISTYKGVASFKDNAVTTFSLPPSKKNASRGVSHPNIVSNVFEDSKGNLWFSTPGGPYKYDGKTLQHISEADGLAGNSVNHILEANNGDIWFATFYNGVSRYDGKTFTNFTKDGTITGDEVWSLFKDKDGNIWFPAENHGVYKYDGKKFTNYGKAQGFETNAIQCIFQDSDGVIWFGGYLGLFRLDGEQVVSVSKKDLELTSE